MSESSKATFEKYAVYLESLPDWYYIPALLASFQIKQGFVERISSYRFEQNLYINTEPLELEEQVKVLYAVYLQGIINVDNDFYQDVAQALNTLVLEPFIDQGNLDGKLFFVRGNSFGGCDYDYLDPTAIIPTKLGIALRDTLYFADYSYKEEFIQNLTENGFNYSDNTLTLYDLSNKDIWLFEYLIIPVDLLNIHKEIPDFMLEQAKLTREKKLQWKVDKVENLKKQLTQLKSELKEELN